MAEEINLPPVAPMPTPLTPKASWTIPLVLILAIFSLAISGYLFWQNRQLQNQLATMQTPSPSPLTTVPSPSGSPQPMAEAADPTAGWETYTSPKNHSIMYPPDWLVETSPENDWKAEVGVPKFSVSKNGYKIVFSFPTAFGPGICIFSDHPDFTNEFLDNPILAESKCPGGFVEIKA
ncbi:DUF2681 domain-containing protein, partial [Patescibacteria group bacterium]|nr:DUF2681 domain-containing protein [Patescibacteria group bacterium]